MTRREFLFASLATVSVYSGALPAEIRAAIIGLEGHYSDLTGAAKALPNLRITAVSDPRPTAKTVGAARRYSDYRKLLAEEKLDVVCVCGDNASRARILQDCAAKKLPIISEKPLGLTFDELSAVKRAVEKNKVPLTMLLQMRGSPPYAAMREIVQRGEIGEVVSMDAQKSYQLGERPEWMKSRKTFGGTIPYIGIHMIDLMRWVSGRDFVEGAAFQSSIATPGIGEMENNCALAFKLDNQGTASLRMDYLRPAAAPSHGDDRLRVVGAKGIVEYRAGDGLTLVTATKGPQRIETFPKTDSISASFIKSLHGQGASLITREEIFRVSEIVLKMREAAERKRIVSL